MLLSEWLQIGTLAVGVASVLILPFVLRGLNRQDAHRQGFREEMHERLSHLDQCVDDLKRQVLGEVASRGELAAAEARVADALNRMRAAISNDTTGLHDRIMRLEDWRLGERDR